MIPRGKYVAAIRGRISGRLSPEGFEHVVNTRFLHYVHSKSFTTVIEVFRVFHLMDVQLMDFQTTTTRLLVIKRHPLTATSVIDTGMMGVGSVIV